jgi:predicted kinase
VSLEGPLLIILGGLPGAGKTTLARALARVTGATHLRIDTIEQALIDTGLAGSREDIGPAGYVVAYRLAADNLRLGRAVIADSVNPIAITRDAWRGVAVEAGVRAVEVEIVCSDAGEHRRRVEGRRSDIPGLVLPTWERVLARHYEPWAGAARVDTAGRGARECLRELLAVLEEG